MFDDIIADLQGWQKQLNERAATLAKDQAAFNEQLVYIQDTIKAHTAGVVLPLTSVKATPKKRSYNKSGFPSAVKMRILVHKVLSSKRKVSMRELIDRLHILLNLDVPKKVGSSKLTSHVYSAVATVKKRKLIKGSRKGFSLTALGRPGNKHWA